MESQKLSVCPEYVRLGENRCFYIQHLEKLFLEGNQDAKKIMETRQINFCGTQNYDECQANKEIVKQRERNTK